MNHETRLERLKGRLDDLYGDSEWEQALLQELGFQRSGSNYSHIRYNLVEGISSCVSLASDQPPDVEELIVNGEFELAIHDIYVALLRQYSEFAQGEFTQIHGRFPELQPAHDVTGYVLRAAEHLRKLSE